MVFPQLLHFHVFSGGVVVVSAMSVASFRFGWRLFGFYHIQKPFDNRINLKTG